MPAVDRERLRDELKRLRGRQGLTPAKLERSPTILRALGNPPSVDAYDRLVSAVHALGEGRDARALRAAYGIGVSVPGLLGDRRAAFGTQEGGRLPDAVELWENEAIDSLVVSLQEGWKGQQPVHLVVSGHVGARGLDLITLDVTNFPAFISKSYNETYHRNRGALSALLYQVTPDLVPTPQPIGNLLLSLHFYGRPRPRRIQSLAAVNLFELTMAPHIEELTFAEGELISVTFKLPMSGWYYGLIWDDQEPAGRADGPKPEET